MRKGTISHHAALIYTMVLISAADRRMPDSELRVIGEMINFLPIFRDYDPNLLTLTTGACAELLDDDQGLEHALELIDAGLPPALYETAYALACDIALADGRVTQEERRVLDLLLRRLRIDRLASVAIERASEARHMTLPASD
jgi:tellurite resistance protein